MVATLPALSVDLVQAAKKSEGFFAGQNPAVIRSAEERYRRFLHLVSKHPDLPLAPSRDVDEMWHLHMLHPRAYHADCLRLFGDILDHDGGFGLGEGELPELQRFFDETALLWEREFGEPYVDEHEGGTPMNKCVKKCRKACRKACNVKRGPFAQSQVTQ
jgi:hypothetical protein